MSEVKQILERFNVDLKSGFLPPKDPLLSLPSPYGEWEDLAEYLTAYINAGSLRQKIDSLELIDNPKFSSAPELEGLCFCFLFLRMLMFTYHQIQ